MVSLNEPVLCLTVIHIVFVDTCCPFGSVQFPEGRLWWRLDDRYALPKAKVTVLIRTATAENKFQRGADPSADLRWDYHAETAMRSNFLTRIFSDALTQDTYDSYLAGLG